MIGAGGLLANLALLLKGPLRLAPGSLHSLVAICWKARHEHASVRPSRTSALIRCTMRRRLSHVSLMLTVASLALVNGCLGRPNALVLRRTSLQFDYPAQRAEQLSWAETVRICDVVARLRVRPAMLYVRQGEQVGFVEHLRTMAFDSAGRELGEPRVLDWQFTGRELETLPGGDVLGQRIGEIDVVVSFPAKACRSSTKRPLPSGIVTVVVGDTGTSTKPPAQ